MIEQAKEIIAGGVKNLDKNSLAIIYQAIFHNPLDISCFKCIYDGFFKIKKHLENNNEIQVIMAKKNKYKIVDANLQPGQTMQVKGYPKVLTTENFTDEDAAYLKKIGQGALIEEVKEEKEVKAKDEKPKA